MHKAGEGDQTELMKLDMDFRGAHWGLKCSLAHVVTKLNLDWLYVNKFEKAKKRNKVYTHQSLVSHGSLSILIIPRLVV